MNNEIRIIRTLYRSLLRTSSKWQSEISRSNSILSVENEIRPFRTYFMEIPKYEENLPDLLMVILFHFFLLQTNSCLLI